MRHRSESGAQGREVQRGGLKAEDRRRSVNTFLFAYGPRSDRTSRLLDQLELQPEELGTAATEDEIAAEVVAAKTSTSVSAFTRKRPARKPLSDHLPRERVVIASPSTCLCRGGLRLSKLAEDITETLRSNRSIEDFAGNRLADQLGPSAQHPDVQYRRATHDGRT